MSYNIGIIGTGYVGLVTGNCFASTGNNVWCIDIDENKVNKLKQAICTIYEPGLDKLLKRNVDNGNIRFSTDLEDCVTNCNIIFLCLPTPPGEDGSADLHYVLQMADSLGKIIKEKKLTDKKIIINKSTVPVGTADKTTEILLKHISKDKFVVVSNPEFLREGVAIEDSLKPDRVVIGTDDNWAMSILKDLYKPFVRNGNPVIFMDQKSAEVTKYAANSFLATKISFMNDLSAYCENVGADIDMIRRGIGSDNRIGNSFLYSGIGYGGSCFPKDVKALVFSAKSVDSPLRIVETTQEVNYFQINRFCQRIVNRFEDALAGKKFAIWGLAFKPNTDDIREAPAHHLIRLLLDKKAILAVYDQEASENTRSVFGDSIVYTDKMYDALDDADALVICTEWNAFRTPDFGIIANKLKNKLIFDGRNLFSPTEMKSIGFEYHSIGRQSVYTT
ncbi:MAG: UDP-glucose/GDP-mannose dehydrogenase family protein [Ignavibacteria bacterium]|jgi:UDPglucose 6-dehydrogenase|nr:UDP-glucose/GDP-mannose dehydrogenase family protein [Ignavibacteria bacterium]